MNSNLTPAPDTGAEPALIQRLTEWARSGLDEPLCDALVPPAASGSATVREILAHPEIVARKPDVDGTRLIVRYRLKVDVSASASRGEIATSEEMRNFFGKTEEDNEPDDLVNCDATMKIAIEAPIQHRPSAKPPEDLVLADDLEILAEPGIDVSPG